MIQRLQISIQLLWQLKLISKAFDFILGGYNKGSDFRLLLSHIKSNSVKTIVTYGEAGGNQNCNRCGKIITSYRSYLAVNQAHYYQGQPGEIVLFSGLCKL